MSRAEQIIQIIEKLSQLTPENKEKVRAYALYLESLHTSSPLPDPRSKEEREEQAKWQNMN